MTPKAHKKRPGSPKPQQPGASKSILKQQTLLEFTPSKKKTNELSVSDPPDDDDDWPSLSTTSATPMDIATLVPDPKTPHIETLQVEKAPSDLDNSASVPPAQKSAASATVTPPALTTPRASVGFASANTVMEDSPDDNMVTVVRKQLAPVFSSTSIRKKTLFLKIRLSVDPKPKDPTAAGRLQLKELGKMMINLDPTMIFISINRQTRTKEMPAINFLSCRRRLRAFSRS